MKQQAILIHYHEIALKGKNRAFFEKKLMVNIKKATRGKKIEKDFGRIIIPLEKEAQFKKLKPRLLKIPGIANFSLAFQVDRGFKEIKKAILKLLKKSDFFKNRVSSFRVTASRGDKSFKFTSEEINKKLGELIVGKTGKKVDLVNPSLEIFVEISFKWAYLYFEKIKGLGGLPVSTAGKLLGLLSGGIDSPVAAFKMIKRGARVDFIHFHSYPQTNQASIEKVKKLIQKLNSFQFQANLFLISFLNWQKEFFKKCDHRYLVILYRRAMFKIAQGIALKEGYRGLVTGESLGQVASQTLENMLVTSRGIKLPIYRPLIGNDKQEIIDLAKKIGTYPISIEPHQDCCSLFIPKHPVTKAKLEDVLEEEKKAKRKEKEIKSLVKPVTVY